MEIFKQFLLYLQLENTRIKKENKELKTELTDIKKEFKIDVLHFPDGTTDYRCRCWAETNDRMNTIRELIKDSLNKTNFDYEFLLNEIYKLTLFSLNRIKEKQKVDLGFWTQDGEYIEDIQEVDLEKE